MPHRDKYRSYAELSTFEEEGKDYTIEVSSGDERSSEIVVIAPHGGGIEKHTSEIAHAIAGEEFTLYLFEGTKSNCNFDILHITSTKFDEPRCVELVKGAQTAIAVHGKKEKQNAVLVGGRDSDLADQITDQLEGAGFTANRARHGSYSGTAADNICNRTATGRGVQLEIYRELRENLADSESRLNDFAHSIRKVLFDHQEEINESTS